MPGRGTRRTVPVPGLPTRRPGEDPVPNTVFFLSDYGMADEFVGVVHGVLRRLAPEATVVDLLHQVPPYDVRAGAAALARAVPHLGPGVVLAVVDPGVGGARRGLVLEVATTTGPRWFVGPDNGLLVAAAGLAGGILHAVALDPAVVGTGAGAERQSPGVPVTFDGRDLFAPAVAALCRGADPEALGGPVPTSTLARVPEPVVEMGTLADGRRLVRTEVTWVDRFGNAQLAAAGGAVPLSVARILLTTAGPPVPVRRVGTFSDLEPGEPGLLSDGNGQLALVVREGSAAEHLGVQPGDQVEVVW